MCGVIGTEKSERVTLTCAARDVHVAPNFPTHMSRHCTLSDQRAYPLVPSSTRYSGNDRRSRGIGRALRDTLGLVQHGHNQPVLTHNPPEFSELRMASHRCHQARPLRCALALKQHMARALLIRAITGGRGGALRHNVS